MDVNNSSSAVSGSLVQALSSYQQQSKPTPKQEEPARVEPQSSAVVTLSARAQQMSRGEATEPAEENNVVSRVSANQVSQMKQPDGIDFIKGDSKGGHINTFA